MQLVPTIVAIAGTILVIVLQRGWSTRDARWFDGKTVTDGKLAGVREQDDGDFWSTIEYEAGGQHYAITGNYFHTREDVGKTLPVAYDPKLPSTARLVEHDSPSPVASMIGLAVVFAAFYIVALTVQVFVGAFRQ